MNWYLISLFLIVTMTTTKYLRSPSLVTFSTLADLGKVLKELLTKLTTSSFLISSKSLGVDVDVEVVEVVVVLLIPWLT